MNSPGIWWLRWRERRRDAQSIWVSRLKLRRGVHVATVALANKNARVVWKLMTSGERYHALPPSPALKSDSGAWRSRAPRGHKASRRGASRATSDPKPVSFSTVLQVEREDGGKTV
jgi:hypothetical protein